MPNEWAIMDNAGIIERGPEDWIKSLWDKPDKIYMQKGITGDLLLIEIHGIVK